MKEPKYSDNDQSGEYNKTYNFRRTSTRPKIETKKRGLNSKLTQEKNSDVNEMFITL